MADTTSALLAQLAEKRRLAALIVPTADTAVRARLRELGHPITHFGEGPYERRQRLRFLLGDLDEDVGDGLTGAGGVVNGDVAMQDAGVEQRDEQEEFYTEGSKELLEARRAIARQSLHRAKARIERLQALSNVRLREHVKHRNTIKEALRGVELYGSQAASERPVSAVRFAPDGQTIAAGDWGGAVSLLDVPNLDRRKVLRGHKERVGGVAWRPGATLTRGRDEVCLASGGGEGDVQLWNLEQDTPVSTLSGHSGRVCRVEFDPSGDFLASASYDTTWRLWDVRTSTELLLAEGHAKEAYVVSYNTDGSLLASGGLDGYGRVWDLRTGRTIMILEGHVREVYALDWGIDGHRVLSGGADGLVICWDVRMVRETARIPAHSRGVTDLRWYKDEGREAVVKMEASTSNGETNGHGQRAETEKAKETELPKAGTFFASCGFDKNVSLFSADDWAPCRALSGHNGNVLGVDIAPAGKWLVSGGYDRTVKLWGRDDGKPV
ncbi:hypothetical protein MRB53_036952 [Persea americana]|nr:hypothetical protein MRB53_036952 [Persea americana]